MYVLVTRLNMQCLKTKKRLSYKQDHLNNWCPFPIFYIQYLNKLKHGQTCCCLDHITTVLAKLSKNSAFLTTTRKHILNIKTKVKHTCMLYTAHFKVLNIAIVQDYEDKEDK